MTPSVPSKTREYHLPKTQGIECLTLQESPVPVPKANEVLLKVHAVSLQFRDLLIASGNYPMGLKDNVVPGSDMSGTIISLGSDVKDWQIGDRVCPNFCTEHIFGDPEPKMLVNCLGGGIDGVLTEYLVVPAHSLVKPPEHLTHIEASTLPCAGLTAYNALLGSRPLKAGDVVLVLGTGGVSIFALQFAVASGAEVIVTSSSDAKLEVAKKLGAKHLINYNKTPAWDEEVMKITKGRGVDHVIEVGGAGTFSKSVGSVRMAGNIYVIGFVGGQADVPDVPMQILQKGIHVSGILIGPRAQFENMNRLISASGLRPAVDKVFPFEQTKEAFKYLESQKHVGKVVIQVAKD